MESVRDFKTGQQVELENQEGAMRLMEKLLDAEAIWNTDVASQRLGVGDMFLYHDDEFATAVECKMDVMSTRTGRYYFELEGNDRTGKPGGVRNTSAGFYLMYDGGDGATLFESAYVREVLLDLYADWIGSDNAGKLRLENWYGFKVLTAADNFRNGKVRKNSTGVVMNITMARQFCVAYTDNANDAQLEDGAELWKYVYPKQLDDIPEPRGKYCRTPHVDRLTGMKKGCL